MAKHMRDGSNSRWQRALIRRQTLRDLGLWRKPLTSRNLYCHLDRNSWHRYGALVCCLSQPGNNTSSSPWCHSLAEVFRFPHTPNKPFSSILHPPILKKLKNLSCCDCVVNQTLVVISFLTFSPQPIYTHWCLSKALLLGGDGSSSEASECDIEVWQQSESFTKVAHFPDDDLKRKQHHFIPLFNHIILLHKLLRKRSSHKQLADKKSTTK